MSKYLPTIEYTTEFEGDTVKIELVKLSRKDYMKIIAVSPTSMGDSGIAQVDIMKVLDSLDSIADIILKSVKSFTGLKDANGDALEFKDIISTTYFTELVMDVMKTLIEKSGRLNEEEEKKSEPQSI